METVLKIVTLIQLWFSFEAIQSLIYVLCKMSLDVCTRANSLDRPGCISTTLRGILRQA